MLGAQVRHFPVEGAPAIFRGVVLFHVIVGIGLALYIVAAAISFLFHARSSSVYGSCHVLSVAGARAKSHSERRRGYININYPAFMADSQAAADFTVQALDWRQAQITTAHVANGSLILAISGVLAINSVRLLQAAGRSGRRSNDYVQSRRRNRRPIERASFAASDNGGDLHEHFNVAHGCRVRAARFCWRELSRIAN